MDDREISATMEWTHRGWTRESTSRPMRNGGLTAGVTRSALGRSCRPSWQVGHYAAGPKAVDEQVFTARGRLHPGREPGGGLLPGRTLRQVSTCPRSAD